MKINPEIFRAYDIRGIYPSELDDKTAYLIGQAFVSFLKKSKPKLAVGCDNRLSSPALRQNLIKGMTDSGACVIDLGLVTTPMLYFAVAHYHYDGGVIVTASHNPAQYNGFKMVRAEAVPISEESGLREIQKLAQSPASSAKIKGETVKKEILRDYIGFNLKGAGKLKPLKIVVDTANAVSGIVVAELFNKLSCQVYHLFEESDGSFPNHSPNPLIEENLKTLRREIKNKKADLGVAFDGDGDRIMFIDENGNSISGDLITAWLSSLILQEEKGGKILYDVRSSNIVKETIKKAGGQPIAYRIGHSFVKEKMRQDDIVFAGEFTGHYYHKEHYFCEAPVFVLLKILGQMSETGQPISQLVKPYQKYYHSGEINFEIKDKKRALRALEDQFKEGKTSKVDGVRIDFKDWWFLARPSNTESLLRLVIEAKSKELLKQKTDLLADILHG